MTREAFEAWWGEQPMELTPCKPSSNDDDVRIWVWQAWQAAVAAEREVSGKDAERYRWLRSDERGMANLSCVINDDCNPPYYELKCTEELDQAIDAAIHARSNEGGT